MFDFWQGGKRLKRMVPYFNMRVLIANAAKRRLIVLLAVAVTFCACASAGANTGTTLTPTQDAIAPYEQGLPPPVVCSGCWHPAPMTSWQVQFAGQLDHSVDADVYEIDLFDTSPSVVRNLHEQGRHAVCYIDAGTWESWRPDASHYPASVLGNANHWPGERWVDIRQLSILAPILTARLDLCRAKGFDAVSFDNLNGYTINTGFPLTYDDQMRFNAYLANAAHARHLSVALINDVGQLSQLVSYFDWVFVEQCFQYKECDLVQPFLAAHKAVMAVEYGLPPSQFCAQAEAMGISAIEKQTNLDAYRVACS